MILNRLLGIVYLPSPWLKSAFSFSFLTIALLCLLASSGKADTVNHSILVEGSALIVNGDIGKARLEAQQNALRQAAMQDNAHIQSFSVSDADGMRIDRLSVRSQLAVQALEPLSEQINGELLTLQMRATLADDVERCEFPAAAYRKKIAAVYFPIEHPQQVWVNDYFGFERGIVGELLRALAATDNFLTRDASEFSLYGDLAQAPAVIGSSANGQPLVTHILTAKGAQFVISGVFRNLGFSLDERTFSGLWGAPTEPRDRHLEIEFFIHDALSGQLLARHRHALIAEGFDVTPKQPTPFGTHAFYSSKYGHLFRQVIDRETQAIAQLLSCRPFVAQVLDVREGKIYLDAGADTGIQAGDILTAYTPDIAGPIFGSDGALAQFGWPKTTLRVIRGFPGYSVAETESTKERNTFSKGQFLNVW